MGTLFPDEFPFNRRRETQEYPAEQAVSVVNTPQPQPEVSAPVDPPVISSSMVASTPYSGPERRRAARQSISLRASMRIGEHSPLRQVQVRNISLMGIGFVLNEPLAANDRCIVRIEAGPLRYSSHLRIACCVPQDDGAYLLGAMFVGNELLRTRDAA